MTTLILQSAGAAVGGALGGPVGAGFGRVLGSAGGAALDGALFGTRAGPRLVEGPRLADVAGLSSTEGDPIPRVYGRARIGGTLIWATRPIEVAATTVERSSSGAKGGGGSKTVRTAYSYYANLAVGLCAGEIAQVRRIWADGTELDLTGLTLRVHTGAPDQDPDPLILAKEGGDAPAYRGLAYAVFERLALAPFGNRIPQFAFEVIRPVNGLAGRVRAVCLIPGSTEFGLDPVPVSEDAGLGATRPANRFQLQGASDVIASLDALQALCPNVRRVAVVASWFGSDLRAGQCTVTPRVDAAAKATHGEAWSVAGLARAGAGEVSRTADGGAAYGGTPSDSGLTRLVAELTRRGLGVVLYPFVMMDVPAGNALPDPRRPGSAQGPYPWRGRITCDPAPGVAGSVDGTPGAADQVARFFERAEGYRRMVLHYADLAAGWGRAGAGLDGFIVGSEFVGLTRVRGPDGGYPAVGAFRDLARAVRARLGSGVALTYAADWTEYGAHTPDGGATLRFPLDALFADAAIDAVGIDYYPPISDWRDGEKHADAAEAAEIYDRAYLKRRLGAGEAFDWYYADEAGRAAQNRLPIHDGAYGKPWVYRPKDLVSWWANPHVERDGGVETRTTAWMPRSKPIWLTEIGVPAVDRGTNGPNVFPDPKSSENAAPPHSRNTRDDLIQLRGLEAILSRFDDDATGFDPAHNPVSPHYGGRMIARDTIFVWCWDARPFPAFPDFDTVWSDAPNWALGHWIGGRVEGVELDRLIALILADLGLAVPLDIDAMGVLDGYVIDRPLSARGALEPLVALFGLDVGASAGTLRIRGPRAAAAQALADGDLVRSGDEAPLRLVRAEESELPRTVEVGFSDGESAEYRRATAAAGRPGGARRRESRVDAAVVTRRILAQAMAEAALETALVGRESAVFTVSPRSIGLEPGDRVRLPGSVGGPLHRIERIQDAPGGRRIESRAVSAVARTVPAAAEARPNRTPPALPGPVLALALDLPVARGTPVPLQVLAVSADPWPGAVAVWRAAGEGSAPALLRVVDYPACLGRTLTALPPGPLWRRDRHARLDVTLRHAQGLAAVDETAALAGANLFALRGADGTVEIVSAAGVELIGPDRWRLSGLLRGLAGSEEAAGRHLPAGGLIVRLDDGAVVPLVERLDEAGRAVSYRIGPADRDPADPAFVGLTATAGLIAFRPLAPVHLSARREPDGVRFAWVRRELRDADAWEPVEVPPTEPEAYRLDILRPDGSVARSLSASGPGVLYAGADETADFGGPQAQITAAVARIGAVFGRGPSTRATVIVRAG